MKKINNETDQSSLTPQMRQAAVGGPGGKIGSGHRAGSNAVALG